MSRNLCETTCQHCDNVPELVEPVHPITREEAGRYFDEFEGMMVAKAICPCCEAEYLAWLDQSNRRRYPRSKMYDGIEDLSYYSSFNDEPGATDGPKWIVEKRWVRVGKVGAAPAKSFEQKLDDFVGCVATYMLYAFITSCAAGVAFALLRMLYDLIVAVYGG